jgi:3-isopropylmalate/(R)-2-methylmalate dehydratase small subunit
MKAVVVVSGRAVPLDRSDVDTDQIIPSDWLKRVERTGFGAGLFAEWRDDRDFVLNDAEFVGANILLAGKNFGIGSSREHAVWALLDYGFEAVVSTKFGHNFGTGSSREHAVWALMDYGFQAVVSSRFADIFRNNCTKQGLLPVQVDAGVSRRLLDAVLADPTTEITIDVANGTIEAPAAGVTGTFPLDEFTRDRLLNGWDDIGLTLRHGDAIDAYEAHRATWLPTSA